MHARFPSLDVLRPQWKARLGDATTLRPDSELRPPWSVLGMAIDYRLRYYFARSETEDLAASSGAALLTGLPGAEVRRRRNRLGADGRDVPTANQERWRIMWEDFTLQFEAFLSESLPVGTRLTRDKENQLCTYCYALALFEEIYRAGPRPTSALLQLSREAGVAAILQIADDPWVDDLRRLSWLFYDEWYVPLTESSSSSPVLNPTFTGSGDVGGADADLIIDGCLIEFKATIEPKLERRTVEQLLGYALLDYDDRYGIGELGIYLVRQGVFVRWEIPWILNAISDGRGASLGSLRREFQQVLGMPRIRKANNVKVRS